MGDLAGDLACGLDPVIFAERCGLTLDAWQRDAVRSRSPRTIWNVSRQAGKSTTAAVIALHRAVFFPGSLVLLVSPSLRQSSELFRVVSRLYGWLGEPVSADAQTLLRLELRNGSRVLSLPASESTVRGYAGVDLLVFDEASRAPDSLYLAMRPMLATSQGRLLLLSTPFGKRGFFSDVWHDGGPVWQRVRVAAQECPRISPAFLAEEREQIGQWWFSQEYECEFVDADSQAFRTEDVQAAQGEFVDTWQL